MSRLMTQKSNSFQGREPLTDNVLRQFAPSIFAEAAHTSRSDRYAYIPTIHVLDGLRKEGFQPFFVAQSKTRLNDRREFTKHMLRLRRSGDINAGEAREVIMINSHDGSSGYKLIAGLIRFVCMNGLVTGEDISSVSVRHSGRVQDEVIEGAYQVVKSFDVADQQVLGMKETKLIPAQATAFAEAALTLRYDEGKAPVTATQILEPQRREDSDPSLWSTFNRVQEHLVNGGVQGVTQRGRRTTTRRINGIDENTKLNRALWTLSARMAELARQ